MGTLKVINNTIRSYPEDPIRYFNFEDYEERANDCQLFIGGWPADSIYESADVPKYFFSTEEQSWPQDGTDQFVPHVDKIFTICPPSITGREKRQAAFFPMNEAVVPKPNKKIWDVIYTGLASGHHVETILYTIRQFNYRLVSFESYSGLTTNMNTGYLEKLDLISKSKACVVHNLTGTGSPQLKSRPFEAAFCRSLMLVQKDQWNIIEEWFEPEVDFMYYTNVQELKELIANADTEAFQGMVVHAFNRAINEYTTEKFVEKYIGWK